MKQLLFLLFFISVICGCKAQPVLIGVKDHQTVVLELENETEGTNENVAEEDEQNEIEEEIKLSLMIYMAADNDLESYALQNLNLMETADYEGINVLVLIDRAEGYDETDGNWTDTRLYKVCNDDNESARIVSERLDCPSLGLSKYSPTELDMANPSVLSNFIKFCRKEYPADEYALIIWGHGTGWRYSPGLNTNESNSRAFAIDDKTDSYMSVHDLGNAVLNQNLSIIGFDTCFAGVLENVYELKNCSEYTVACAGVTPSIGWNYKELLEKIGSEDFSSFSIAKAMAVSSPVQTTVFINENLQLLINSFEEFSKALSQSIQNDKERKQVFDLLLGLKSYSYTQYPCDLYLDLSALADAYLENNENALKSAAKDFKEKISEAVCSINNQPCQIGVHFISLVSQKTTASLHSADYIKNPNRIDQCQFIKQSNWWVPTVEGTSGSLLDKLFYNGV